MFGKKSAKNIAWNKERTTYEKRLKDMALDNENVRLELELELSTAQDKIRSLEDWVERLLEFTELSPEQALKWITQCKQ